MASKKASALFGNEERIARVYGSGRRERIAQMTALYPSVVNSRNLPDHLESLADTEVIFATWGMPALSSECLDKLPALKAVFYAAGSVQGFARPLLERGITLVSAWRANAIPVAEFTLAQILLAGKSYWRNTQDCRSLLGRQSSHGPGNFGETVAILGAGVIGRKLIGLLRPFDLRVIVYDPFLTDSDADALSVEKVPLPEAFARGLVVTNHLADKPETRKILGEELFLSMRDGATFINTGRGATVDEVALVRVFTARPSLTALLDVTDPEPPPADSPLHALPNVHVTSHIAGAIGNEVLRMADLCLDEFQAWEKGQKLTSEVTLPMLDHMA
jgi:phosphoglycerate dehydrogenase-like enzyme